MKVAGYICTKQKLADSQLLELKIQKEQVEEFCLKNNYTLIKIYEDVIENHEDMRVGLISLVNDSNKNMFKKVILLKMDRIGKDKSLVNWFSKELLKNNVEVFSIIEESTLATLSHSHESQSKIEKLIRKVNNIPSLPEVVSKVIELVSDPLSSAAKLSRIIVHDPGLTARVLKLVNSAYYGFPRQISSIQQAIMILGFTTLRGLVLSSSIFKIFPPKHDGDTNIKFDYKQFWKHSINCGLIARSIVSKLYIQEADDAFSAGLLHDIGMIILDQYDHDEYLNVIGHFQGSKNDYKTLMDLEMQYVGTTHSEIGYKVAEKWNLPRGLAQCIRHHHEPFNAVENKALVCVIHLANFISNWLEEPDKIIKIDDIDQHVLEYLGIGEETFYDLVTIAKNDVAEGPDIESFINN